MNRIVVLFLLLSSNVFSQNYVLDESYWEPDGVVNAVAYDSITNSLFLGGNFHYIGPRSEHGAILENNQNVFCDEPNESVKVSISDGNGGWFIGGDFTSVGGMPRERIAHVDSNGLVIDELGTSGFDNQVTCMYLDDSILIVGGDFGTYSDNNTRSNSAEFSMNDYNNLNLSFPEANGNVYSSVSDGNGGYYIAGSFTMVGDSVRNNLAQITSGGQISSWNPNLSSLRINSIMKLGNELFVPCTNFTQNGYLSTIYKVDATSGFVTNANVVVIGEVNAFEIANDTLFVGGDFDSINGVARGHFACLDPNDFSVLSSTLIFNNEVNSILKINDKLLIGGAFTNLNGQTRKGFASLDLTNLAVNNTTINSNGLINSMCIKDTILYLVGDFDTLNSLVRKNFGAYNLLHSTLSNQIFDFNLPVSAIEISNDLLLVGGSFFQVNTISSKSLVIINPLTGVIYPSEINPYGNIFTISVFSNKVFIGGDFDGAGVKFRTRLCGINLNTLLLTNWKPVASSIVYAITKFNGDILVGGAFNAINNTTRNKFASLNSVSGLLNPLNLIANNTVKCFEVMDTTLYIGGIFTSFGGQSRAYGAAINQNGTLTPWNPGANSPINSIEKNGNDLFIAGKFTSVNGQARKLVAKVNNTTGAVGSWIPQVTELLPFTDMSVVNEVYSIECYQNKLLVGGWFSDYLNSGKSYLVALDVNTGYIDTLFPNSDSYVYTISTNNNNRIYVGGRFLSAGGITLRDLVQIDLATKRPTRWRPSTDWKVLSLKVKDSILYVGGNFESINEQPRYGLASFNILNESLTNWSPVFYHSAGLTSDYVYNIEVSDDNLYVSGVFTQIDSQPRSTIAAFDQLTGGLTSWSPHFESGSIGSLKIHEDRLYVLGNFELVNGQSRPSICSFDDNTGDLLPFKLDTNLVNPGCKAIDFHNDISYIQGGFSLAGTMHPIAKVDEISGQIVDTFNLNQLLNGTRFLEALENSYITSFAELNSPFGVHQLRQLNYFNDDLVQNISLWNFDNQANIELVNNQLFVFGDFVDLNNIGRKYFASTTISDLIVNPQIDTIITCDSYLWAQTNQTYTQSGIYTAYFTTAAGYDSMLVINLTINHATHFNDSIINCAPITWIDGNTYSQSNDTTTYLLVNSNGCDSIVHLHFILSPLENDTLTTISTCENYYWDQTNQTYSLSGYYNDTILSIAGCDSIVVLNLSLIPSDTTIETLTVCESIVWLDGNTYFTDTNDVFYTLTNINGCDSIIELNATVIQLVTATHQLFSLPSSELSCDGKLAISSTGNLDFELSIDGNSAFSSSGYTLRSGLCPGIHDLQSIDYCGDTIHQTFVIPIDSNYVFYNPFIDSIAIDSLGWTITNCDIYYGSIDTAYIDSIWGIGNQVNVIWNIVDSNGSNLDTASYELNNGFGVYWLQLSVFCPTRAIGDYFTVTQAIYFGNTGPELVDVNEIEGELSSVNLYPNPAKEEIMISYSSDLLASVRLFDSQGKLIQQLELFSGDKISLMNLESGIYFIQLNLEGNIFTEKIIKR